MAVTIFKYSTLYIPYMYMEVGFNALSYIIQKFGTTLLVF